MTGAELTGRARSHLVELDELGGALHIHAATPFLNMREAAFDAGFDLRPVSSFRDFDRQMFIWNAKFNGDRPLYDSQGCVLETARMTPSERIAAILLWSALPGGSRHHWGTDLDLIDARALDPAQVELTAQEFGPAGPFAPLSAWLDKHAQRFGFFRPFRGVRSGVQAEPWHVSFAPVAESARRALTPGVLREALIDAPLLGKDHVMRHIDALHARYVAAIDWP